MMQISKSISRRKFMQVMIAASSAAAIDWTGLGAIAGSIPGKADYPVVVIGAGLGGLVSAAYLAKYGFAVTMLEQHRIPGGYATAFFRKKGKYCFDVSLHATVAEHAMPQMILSDLGVWDQLEVVDTPELRRIISPGFDVTLPAKNPSGVKAALSRVFPHEEKGIHAFYSEMEAVIAAVWQTNKASVAVMEKLEKITLQQWMAMHVTDPGAAQCLAVFSGYFGLGPAKVNALFYAIAAGEFLVHGGQYYKTRSQDLSNALANAIEARNGQIHYKTKVVEILFDHDHAVRGVKDSDGTVYPARAVIVNCSIPALMDTMLPPAVVPENYRNIVRQRRKSRSSFVVWLGLDASINHLVKDYEIDIQAGPQRFVEPLGPTADLGDANISVTIYDNLVKGYSRPGTTTMSIMCLADYAPWKKFEEDYFNGIKGAYRQEKERIAASLIKRVALKLIPGLEEMIEVMEVGTPLTNVRYTGNSEGAIYGYDRDMPHLKAETPVKGLFLASAWSHGGGYTPVMMAGRQAAKALLEGFRGSNAGKAMH